MKRIFLASIFIFVTVIITAHEFWLEPYKFLYKAGETVRIKFLVGEHFKGENWNGNRQNIHDLHLYYNNVEDELEEYIADSATGNSLDMQFFDEGTAMITFNSNNKYIELEPSKFLTYLQEDGLQNAIDYRKEHLESDSLGREYYQRSVKTILQIGSVKSDNFNLETELPIDIIPLSHPYSLKKGQQLKVKILFKKEPLANAKVKLWHKFNGKTKETESITDSEGQLSLPISTVGRWMISTVKMERLEKDEKAQWQSYWGSLTWGYTK